MKAESKLFGKRMELFIACFRGWKEKARHQWQVVAEAVMIAETDVGAAWLHASVLLVFLEQERQVVNPTVKQPAAPAAAYKDMVQTSPLPLILVCAFSAMRALHTLRHVCQSMLRQSDKGAVARIVVEVAGNNDVRIRRHLSQGVNGLAKPLCHLQPIGARRTFPTRPARCVHHIDVERVAIDQSS